MATAARLAAWVGVQGRPVTPGGALRPSEVPEAGRAAGVGTKAKVRRAADVPDVHRPWLAAVATGMITISGGRATAAGAATGDPLRAWHTALLTLLNAEVKDVYQTDPRIIALVTLTVVEHQSPPEGYMLQRRVEEAMYDRGDWENFCNGQLHGTAHPADAAVSVLRAFDVLDGMRLTPIGAWLRTELAQAVPPQITPRMPADRLLEQLAGANETDAWNRARRCWFGDRTTEQITAQLLQAAADATPAQRMTAIGLICELGQDALPALRTAETVPTLAPHVRAITRQYGQGPAPDNADLVWLATEYAHADLTTHGTAAARYSAMDTLEAAGLHLDGAAIKPIIDGGHPQAAELTTALEPILDTAIPALQLKVTLGPGCWRRVLVPENATLETLHLVIKALMGWSDDHLHVFSVGRRHYADEFHRLEDTRPEHLIRLHQALPEPKTTISYVYDLGDSWRHEILLEKVLDQHLPHPECTAGRGDNPIEDYNPEFPEEPVSFDREAINKSLQQL
jgi:hypothetical protein